MGRKDSDELSAAQIMYPCMQCADVFFLKADICQLGMDQRKVRERRDGFACMDTYACMLVWTSNSPPPFVVGISHNR